MKAISLWQPWATLWVFQIKRFETRSWPFPEWCKGPIAVHAAKKRINPDNVGEWWLEAVEHEFEKAGIQYSDLPYGALIGVCDGMTSCPTEGYRPNDLEAMLGDWSFGRHYWIPKNMRPLPEPVRVIGRQAFSMFRIILFQAADPPDSASSQLGLFNNGLSAKDF